MIKRIILIISIVSWVMLGIITHGVKLTVPIFFVKAVYPIFSTLPRSMEIISMVTGLEVGNYWDVGMLPFIAGLTILICGNHIKDTRFHVFRFFIGWFILHQIVCPFELIAGCIVSINMVAFPVLKIVAWTLDEAFCAKGFMFYIVSCAVATAWLTDEIVKRRAA